MITVLKQKMRKYWHWHTLKRAPNSLCDQYYFAYGANVSEKRFADNHMHFEYLGKACAPGRRLDFSLRTYLEGMGYASLAEDPTSEAWGVLYKMDHASLRLLDVLEWVNYGYYKRIPITVQNGEQTLTAWAYEATRPCTGLMPASEYVTQIIRVAEKLEYPASYIEHLRRAKHAPHKSFPRNIAFRIDNLDRERLFPNTLESFYQWHDRLRSIVMNRLP